MGSVIHLISYSHIVAFALRHQVPGGHGRTEDERKILVLASTYTYYVTNRCDTLASVGKFRLTLIRLQI